MNHLFRIALLTFLLPSALLAQPKFQLGVNLVNDGAFVNIVNHTARYNNAAGFDERGWPTSDFDLVLMDGRPVAEWTGQIDDPEEYRIDYSGTYKGQFTGQASVTATGDATLQNLSYDAQTNTTTFDLIVGQPAPNHALVFLNFSNTQRTPSDPVNTGIAGLIVNRPGYPLGVGKVFTDEYIALCKAADFACYRFYTLQNIWNGEPVYPAVTKWADRKTPSDAAQVSLESTSGKRDGWCWEYIIELANILKKDIWICIHLSCDKEYVTSLARMLKDGLQEPVNIYVESSNELWSPTQTTHGPYNAADATARGIGFNENHARRTVELSLWFAEVFGQEEINKRIRVIMAGQHAYNGRSDIHLNYINDTFGPPKNYIYATSTALYFGSENASSTDPDVIAAGMNKAINTQIVDATASTYRNNHIQKAEQWDLPGGCTSYEGGPHLPAGGGTDNLDAQILAHRTARMYDVLNYNCIQGWEELGGGLAMHFTLSSAYTRYGCWGLTDDYTNPDRNWKMQAMRDIIQRTTTSVQPPEAVRTAALQLSPNPADAYLYVHTESPLDIRITDIVGRTVWSGHVDGVATVRTAGWHPGMYFVITGKQSQGFVKL